MLTSSSDVSARLNNADEQALNELTEQLSNFNWKEGVVDRAKHLLYSNNIDQNIKAALSLKAMLCIGRDEVYEVAQEVIDAGVIARLAEFLRIDNPDLQYPAAFCLTNVAAGLDEQTKAVVEAGAIDPLIGFLTCPNAQLRRQAIFCLANVGGSIPQYRIMLARHPQFFTSMFEAADRAEDAKVLELICWNLRNLCLLGGPTFAEIKPGIEFFLNRIIKNYWNFSYWQSCFRFALESLCSTIRQEEGREFLLQWNLTEHVLHILGRCRHSQAAMNPLAFEVMAWILVFGRREDRESFVQDSEVMTLFLTKALPGQLGAAVQEMALKCLAALSSDPDRLLLIYAAHEELFDLCLRLFLCNPLSSTGGPSDEWGPTPVSTPNMTITIKECAGYIFVHLCLLTTQIPSLLLKVMVSNEIVTVLLDVIETGADQLRQKQQVISASSSGVSEGTTTLTTTTSLTTANPTVPTGGPPMTFISESLTAVGLKALVSLVELSGHLASREHLPENPLLRLCIESDAIERLRKVLDSTALPPEAFGFGNVLLQGLLEAVS